jgi:hypothetical protein
MKQCTVLLSFIFCLLAAPLPAQTTIGGGACTSASLNGVYAVSITGRQVDRIGGGAAYTNVFQANGSAAFDGLSQVTLTLVSDTNQAVSSSLTWSGTYSVQANCAAVMKASIFW